MSLGNNDWEDGDSIGCSIGGGWRHRISDTVRGDLGAVHYSQCLVGKPFNNDGEMTSDHFYYYLEKIW